jgi:hypothetical protein
MLGTLPARRRGVCIARLERQSTEENHHSPKSVTTLRKRFIMDLPFLPGVFVPLGVVIVRMALGRR